MAFWLADRRDGQEADWIQRFDPRFWTVDFPRPMMASVVTTGAPVLLKDINDYLTGGMLTLGAIAVAIMIVILLVLFDVRWRLLPMAVILIGIVWAFGLAGYLGIPLTIVTIAGLPVMLGIGIDYAIQMHARVEEEVVIDREAHPIQETARNLCPALLVVTFDAIFAFAAIGLSCNGAVGLAIELLTVPPSVLPGEPFTTRSRVCNRGDAPSGPATR